MAKPTAPSIGTRILYYGAAAPAPTAYQSPASNAQPADIIGPGGGGLPGLVVSVAGAAPDYIGMLVIVYGADGSSNMRSRMVNIATWQTAGSDPAKARWDYVDLSA